MSDSDNEIESMARPASVNIDDVMRAIDALESRDETVNVQSVIEELQSSSSRTTINNLLRQARRIKKYASMTDLDIAKSFDVHAGSLKEEVDTVLHVISMLRAENRFLKDLLIQNKINVPRTFSDQ